VLFMKTTLQTRRQRARYPIATVQFAPGTNYPKHCKNQTDVKLITLAKSLNLPVARYAAHMSGISSYSTSTNRLEILAEAEHDRWVTERKADGWKYRPGKKDIDAKKSPYLVPWNKLSDEIKEYDRHTVEKLSRYLAMEGFEVVQISPDAPA